MTRYQHGTIYLRDRRRGPAMWEFRFTEHGKRRSLILGSTDKLKNLSAAEREAEQHRTTINADCGYRAVTFGLLLQRYINEEMPSRYSTKTFYMPWLKNHIKPKWADVLASKVGYPPIAVENWLKGLSLSPKSKAHIRSLMRIILDCGMRWGLLPVTENPLSKVRIVGSSRRKREPIVLTAEQMMQIVVRLPEPYQTMVTVAACLGLRAGEVAGLKWGDVDFVGQEIMVQRSVVVGRVGTVKTVYSLKNLPLQPQLAGRLQTYKLNYGHGCGADDWLFLNRDTGFSYATNHIQREYIRPAGWAIGIKRNVGWHAFRHSYSTLLRSLGVDPKVQQELLRHADIRTTMNTYTQAVSEQLRSANGQLVEMVFQAQREVNDASRRASA